MLNTSAVRSVFYPGNVFRVCAHAVCVSAFLLTLSGCDASPELSRDDAKKMIVDKLEYPAEVLETRYAKHVAMASHVEKGLLRLVDSYEKAGLGTGKVTRKRDSRGYIDYIMEFEFDASTRPFARGELTAGSLGRDAVTYQEFVVYVRDFGEVTGIAYLNEEKTLAKVEYTETRSATPIYTGKPLETSPEMARFQLYDDGWRIVD